MLAPPGKQYQPLISTTALTERVPPPLISAAHAGRMCESAALNIAPTRPTLPAVGEASARPLASATGERWLFPLVICQDEIPTPYAQMSSAAAQGCESLERRTAGRDAQP